MNRYTCRSRYYYCVFVLFKEKPDTWVTYSHCSRTDLNHLFRTRTKWDAPRQNQQNECAPKFDALNGKLRTQGFFMRTAKALIRLGGCPSWSESSLGAQVILLVLSCCGSSTHNFTGNWQHCLSWISERERMTVEIISSKISTKVALPGWGPNSRSAALPTALTGPTSFSLQQYDI